MFKKILLAFVNLFVQYSEVTTRKYDIPTNLPLFEVKDD
jgi:hypothetical protein